MGMIRPSRVRVASGNVRPAPFDRERIQIPDQMRKVAVAKQCVASHEVTLARQCQRRQHRVEETLMVTGQQDRTGHGHMLHREDPAAPVKDEKPLGDDPQ